VTGLRATQACCPQTLWLHDAARMREMGCVASTQGRNVLDQSSWEGNMRRVAASAALIGLLLLSPASAEAIVPGHQAGSSSASGGKSTGASN
jgi:hypothetical protein